MIARLADVRDPVNASSRIVRLSSCREFLEEVLHELIDCASQPDEVDEELLCYHVAFYEGADALVLLIEPHKLPRASRQFLVDLFGPVDPTGQNFWSSARLTAQDSFGITLPCSLPDTPSNPMGLRLIAPE